MKRDELGACVVKDHGLDLGSGGHDLSLEVVHPDCGRPDRRIGVSTPARSIRRSVSTRR